MEEDIISYFDLQESKLCRVFFNSLEFFLEKYKTQIKTYLKKQLKQIIFFFFFTASFSFLSPSEVTDRWEQFTREPLIFLDFFLNHLLIFFLQTRRTEVITIVITHSHYSTVSFLKFTCGVPLQYHPRVT